MSDDLATALAAIEAKLAGADLGGTVKFALEGLGAITVDDDGARVADDDADVTLSASVEVFKDILDGATNPTTAFMTGKLSVDGDMGLAMKLAQNLA